MSADKPDVAAEHRTSLLHRLQTLSDPAIHDYTVKLRARYGKYARPAEEVRRMVDQAMGSTTLTEVLYRMRNEGP